MSTETIVAIVGTLVSAVASGGWLREWLKGRTDQKKLQGDQELADKQQPVDQYSALVGKVEQTYASMLQAERERRVADVAALILRIDKMETAHVKCMEEHMQTAKQFGEHRAATAEKLGELNGRIAELRQRVDVNSNATNQVREQAALAKATADVTKERVDRVSDSGVIHP